MSCHFRQIKGVPVLLSVGFILAGFCLIGCEETPRYQLVPSSPIGAYRLDQKSGEVVWIIRDKMYPVYTQGEKDARVQRERELGFEPIPTGRFVPVGPQKPKFKYLDGEPPDGYEGKK